MISGLRPGLHISTIPKRVSLFSGSSYPCQNMTAEQPNPADYLQGRTNPCFRSGCMRRLQSKDDTICYKCRVAEERPKYAEQLLAAKNAPSDKWYYLWHFQTTL